MIVNIDDILGKPKNRVNKMGIELEGGWDVLPPKIRLEPDGSVYRGRRKPGISYGELPIGPIRPASVSRWLKKYYPHHQDASCGMHVHMSFESVRYYGWLMDSEDYQDTIIEYLTRWAKEENFPVGHHIWERLEGLSPFCQKKFWPDLQFSAPKDHDQQREGHRYTIVHYCGRQMTIEVRVLPMMNTVAQAVRGIKQVQDITNAVLYKLAKKEVRLRVQCDLPGDTYYRDFEEEIPLTASQRHRLR